MSSQQPKPRKWIKKEIEALDPNVDYQRIYQLSTGYGVSDFMNTLIYSLTFPNFIVTTWGARVVWREDGGKVWKKAGARIEETEHTNAIWWWYGAGDPRCQAAVEKINKLHAHWAKQYPGDFSHQDDYVYTMTFSVVLMHRLRLRVGLPGISEKEKIAAYNFWGAMFPLFFSENRVPLKGWPSNFDECIKYCEDFENLPKPGSEQGHLCTEAIFNFFAWKYFHPSLHWLGRSIPVALSLPTTLKAHHIEPVNPILTAIIRFGFKCLLWLHEHVLPDSQVAYIPMTEAQSDGERKQRAEEIRKLDQEYIPFFAGYAAEESLPQFGACPYHGVLKAFANGSQKTVKGV